MDKSLFVNRGDETNAVDEGDDFGNDCGSAGNLSALIRTGRDCSCSGFDRTGG